LLLISSALPVYYLECKFWNGSSFTLKTLERKHLIPDYHDLELISRIKTDMQELNEWYDIWELLKSLIRFFQVPLDDQYS
jgi:hypothetical protein